MPDTSPSPLLEFPRALSQVLEHAAALPAPATEQVQLGESLQRTLAAPILADRNLPPFRRSTRDGFAVTAESIATGSVTIIGTIRAGEIWPADREPLAANQAVAIMTGAPVPPGANSVLMSEHSVRNQNTLSLAPNRSLAAGENIVPEGAEALAGATLVPAGTRISAAEIALAAACGHITPVVYARPRVAILSTGDELVPPHSHPGAAQIRNSNAPALAAMISAHAALPIAQQILPDSLDAIVAALQSAHASDANLLLLSGGVSVGDYDLVEAALSQLNAEFFFTGVNMQPGRPVVFGRIPPSHTSPRTLYFFGLPGNPVSVHVCYLLFVAPFLAALSGGAAAPPRFALATLAEEIRVRPGTQKFLPAYFSFDFESPTARLVPWQGSGDLSANARANAYLALPPDCTTLPAGAVVRLLLR